MYISKNLKHITNADIILDIRTPQEYATIKLNGNHIHIPMQQLNVADFIKNQANKQTIYILCASGIRAKKVQQMFLQNNYSNVKVISGGIFNSKKDTNQGNIKINDNADSIKCINTKIFAQFRAILGAILLTFITLAIVFNCNYIYVPLLFSIMLIISAFINNCMLVNLLQKLPFNK